MREGGREEHVLQQEEEDLGAALGDVGGGRVLREVDGVVPAEVGEEG